MQIYKTKGTCAKEIWLEVENQIVKNVKFVGGCVGNTNAIEKLVEGMPISDVIARLKGIVCRGNTSCPDQLAKALEEEIKKQ